MEEFASKLEKNIIVDYKITDFEYTSRMNMEVRRNIPRCICIDCSGETRDGRMLWRIFNSLFEADYHSKKQHPDFINNMVLNWEAGEGTKILKMDNGGNASFYATKEEDAKALGTDMRQDEQEHARSGGGEDVSQEREAPEPTQKRNMKNTKKILPLFVPEIVERKKNMASLELHKINKNKDKENRYLWVEQGMEGLRVWKSGEHVSGD